MINVKLRNKSEQKDDPSNQPFKLVLIYDTKRNYNEGDNIRPSQIYFEPHHLSIPANSNSPLAITGLAFFRELLESTFQSIELEIKHKISVNPNNIPNKYILALKITQGQFENNKNMVSLSIEILDRTYHLG